jgi:hypothetical protein
MDERPADEREGDPQMQRLTGGLLALALALAVVLTIQWTAPAAPAYDRHLVFQTWSESLTRRAEHQAAEKARAERVRQVWAERLTNMAAQYQTQRGMNDRAKHAWSERLTALAEYYGARD